MFHPQGPTFRELMAQAMSSTEHGYDLLARKFDYTPFRTPQLVIDAVGRCLAPLGPFGAGLDICCGTGVAMAMLRPLCTERVVGLDFSRGMLEVCKEQTAGAPGSAALEYVFGDALAMPFDAEFDVAVCFGAHGHILRKDEDRFVAEVARVLRPGGRWVFAVPHPFRWCLPDDPGEGGLRVRDSYFDRRPYVEQDEGGVATYVEHHRTLGDRVRELTAAGLALRDLLEPEYPEDLGDRWGGGWSALRGRLVPGTAIFVTEKP
jgi:SAM-dependent methyltransferase